MRAGTFGYLPPMTTEQLHVQIRWVLERGLIPAVEFADRQHLGARYWSMWKLPLFGVREPADVLVEVRACAVEHPGCWIRVVGYDPKHGGLGAAFVVLAPDEA